MSTAFRSGSPPPMRGKVHGFPACTCGTGITPAYAGKSHGTASRCGSRQDHPRLCGEKNKHHTAAVGIAGSPPPMRGKGCNYIIRLFAYGITPAYAGKSASTRSAGRCTQDHPRLCGEKCSNENRRKNMIGSPPPMRGKARTYSRKFHYTRITPAYAGKRCCHQTSSR